MSIATASDPEMAPARPLLMPLLSATACAALADWLFYDWQIGISLALFLGVLGAVAVAGNRVYATRPVQIVMAAIFAAGLLALIEDVNVLSVIVGTLASAGSSRASNSSAIRSASSRAISYRSASTQT